MLKYLQNIFIVFCLQVNPSETNHRAIFCTKRLITKQPKQNVYCPQLVCMIGPENNLPYISLFVFEQFYLQQKFKWNYLFNFHEFSTRNLWYDLQRFFLRRSWAFRSFFWKKLRLNQNTLLTQPWRLRLHLPCFDEMLVVMVTTTHWA